MTTHPTAASSCADCRTMPAHVEYSGRAMCRSCYEALVPSWKRGCVGQSVRAPQTPDEMALKAAERGAARRRIAIGALWVVGGLAVTGVTYLIASGGGTYLVTWGAVIYGGIEMVKGMAALAVGRASAFGWASDA